MAVIRTLQRWRKQEQADFPAIDRGPGPISKKRETTEVGAGIKRRLGARAVSWHSLASIPITERKTKRLERR